MRTICTISKIQLTVVAFGKVYVGGIDEDGVELAGVKGETTDADRRQYLCTNCGTDFDGTESFEACRAHLGGVVERLRQPFLGAPKSLDNEAIGVVA